MIGTRNPDADVPAALMALAGGHGRLLWHKSKPWVSATFSGSRDELCFEYMGAEAVAAGGAMLSGLRDKDIPLPGRIVADAELGWHTQLKKPADRIVAVVELLLVED